MSDSFSAFLAVHVVAGTIALIVAPLAMVTAKGRIWHRRWGRIYFWMMGVVAATAGAMCWLRSGLFLFLVAIFSFYLALTGYTALRRKSPAGRASPLEWLSAIVMILTGGVLVLTAFRPAGSGGFWIPLVFGVIGLFLAGQQIFRFVKPSPDARAWLYAHMTRFLAAYIATVSAFSVVNFTFLPPVWRWLWPTVVGTIGIVFWQRHYEKRFSTAAERGTPS